MFVDVKDNCLKRKTSRNWLRAIIEWIISIWMKLFDFGGLSLPNCGFRQKNEECKGVKKSKHRITVCFIVNAAGGKEKPFVIGNPYCFCNLSWPAEVWRYYGLNLQTLHQSCSCSIKPVFVCRILMKVKLT